MTDRIIRIDDIRLAGHCVKGARDWFDRHDLDFKDFVKNGIPENKFLESGDALAKKIVDKKLERESSGRR